MAVIINKVDLSNERAEEIVKLCEEHQILLAGTIPYDQSVIQAVNEGKYVIEYDTEAAVTLKLIYKTLKSHFLLSKEEL